MVKNIGIGEAPKDLDTSKSDKNCPYTGSLTVRGNVIKGKVISAASPLSATVQVERQVFVPKYKRYKKRFSKTRVHNPGVINAQVGDIVEFVGCRPISKTKSNVIIRVLP